MAAMSDAGTDWLGRMHANDTSSSDEEDDRGKVRMSLASACLTLMKGLLGWDVAHRQASTFHGSSQCFSTHFLQHQAPLKQTTAQSKGLANAASHSQHGSPPPLHHASTLDDDEVSLKSMLG